MPSANSGDRPYPAANMLLPFRVSSIRPSGDDGVIRMKRDEYDELLQRQPVAALRYIDESDGEVILVGSSLELDQRLREPIPKLAPSNAKGPQGSRRNESTKMHRFDVDGDGTVVDAWRQLDERTTAEGQKAKEVFFGRGAAILENDPSKAEVRFGQVSPPRSSLRLSPEIPQENPHASRWAAYSNLPGSFDHEPVAVVTEETSETPQQTVPDVTTALVEQPTTATPRSAFDVMAEAAAASVRSSTVQVPATQKQKNEHQPLIDMFLSEQVPAESPQHSNAPKEQTKQWQPLLDLFEGQLAELAAPATADARTSSPNKIESSSSHKGPFAQKSIELLTQSMHSLLNGVGQLAATVKKTNSELQQQITLAQQDFPNNIEKALKASVAAIESLKSMLPATNVDSNTSIGRSGLHSELGSSSEEEATNETRERAIILLNRHKLQKYLKAEKPPGQEELKMFDSILTNLESSGKSWDAELLVQTKIHKVLKGIVRMPVVPGDQEFAFKERCAQILVPWMKKIDEYRHSKKQNLPTKPEEASEISEPKKASKSPRESLPPADDEQVRRVEKVTEMMRVQLLEMGLLPPPAKRLLGGVYTRADVLEAYFLKFNQLRTECETSIEPVSHLETLSTQEQVNKHVEEALEEAYARGEQMRKAALEVNESAQPSDGIQTTSKEEATRTVPTVPKKAVSFDHLTADINPEGLYLATAAGSNERGYRKTFPARLTPQKHEDARSLSTENKTQDDLSVHGQPSSARNGQTAQARQGATPRQLRHRQSWHPSSTPAHFQSFSASPAEAMARYPPISQFYNSAHDPWVQTSVVQPLGSTPWTITGPASGSPLRPIHPRSPTIVRGEQGGAGNTLQSATEGTSKVQEATKIEESALESGPRRSTSTRVTRAEQDRQRGGRHPRASERFAERRRRRVDDTEGKTFKDGLEEIKRNNEISHCIKQLMEMGFEHSNANAAATAAAGNLESALDVLNEDTAAWKAKAQEGGEHSRVREDVPGSWGSWDDELYG